jgi:hypothetical protein
LFRGGSSVTNKMNKQTLGVCYPPPGDEAMKDGGKFSRRPCFLLQRLP